MKQITCPVCETATTQDTEFCPECSWDIDRSAGELIIGDPAELQQEAERKQHKLQQYRTLYQQAKRVEGFETRLAELENEQRTTRKNIAKLDVGAQRMKMLEQRITALESAQSQNPTIDTLQNRLTALEAWQQGDFRSKRLRSEPRTVSENDMQTVFQVRENGRPLWYLANDFEVQEQVIRDHATSLMWQRGGSEKGLGYAEALTYIEQLNREQFSGYADWRLPTVNELLSLMIATQENGDLYISRAFDVRQRWCWSIDKRSSLSVWGVRFSGGLVGWSSLNGINTFVRVVRS